MGQGAIRHRQESLMRKCWLRARLCWMAAVLPASSGDSRALGREVEKGSSILVEQPHVLIRYCWLQ